MTAYFDTTLLLAMACLSGILLLFAIVLMAVWVWMLNDWTKRAKMDPAAHERYRIHMIIGWPFGYYLNVYRKYGPAQKSE